MPRAQSDALQDIQLIRATLGPDGRIEPTVDRFVIGRPPIAPRHCVPSRDELRQPDLETQAIQAFSPHKTDPAAEHPMPTTY